MTDPKPALAIVNPCSGGGATHEAFRRAEHGILDRLGALDVIFTEEPGHGTIVARNALHRGVRDILVAGGDGTINEVVNGWLDPEGRAWSPESTLYLLCGGTGGDLRRTLGITDADTSLAALTSGSVMKMDVGSVHFAGGHRFFANVASLGLSALVDERVGRWGALGSRVAYSVATLEALFSWRNPRITLDISEGGGAFHASLPAAVVAVANGQYFGGGMRIAPEANLEDGTFHVTILGDLRRRDLLGLTQSIRSGEHLDDSNVMSRTGTSIVATSDETVHLDIDGEPIGELPARFEILPGAIRVGMP